MTPETPKPPEATQAPGTEETAAEAPKNPAEGKLRDLIIISSSLIKLLEKENRALRDQKPQEVAALLEEKTKLARAYESRIKGLQEKPDALAEADAELRERLKLVGEKVADLMEENAKLLKIALSVSRRVMDTVADAVKSVNAGTGAYGANGSIAERNPRAPGGVAISVNQSL